ncbi:MAG TPA: hypothetical protein PLE85_06835 [Bacteroidales bacterium]|nr:hypothetical protein [Bacteroidales bacterium]
MRSSATGLQLTQFVPSFILDAAAIALVYFMPALSHLLQFPLYLIEPMRIAVILAVLHTRPVNAYFLALTLPAFSFAVSAHPHFYKALLISAELLLNVWLFYFIRKRQQNDLTAIALSVVLSKVVYYGLKALFISALLLPQGPLVSTPLWIQASTLLAFCIYAWARNNVRKRLSSAS